MSGARSEWSWQPSDQEFEDLEAPVLVQFEVGIVSGADRLVTFLAEVFDLDRRLPEGLSGRNAAPP